MTQRRPRQPRISTGWLHLVSFGSGSGGKRGGFEKGADVFGHRKSSYLTELRQRPSCIGKYSSPTLLRLSHAVELLLDEGNESVPLSVNLDTTELEQGLGTLFDPAHAAIVEAFGDDVLHCAFDDTRGDFIIVVA